MTKGVTQFSIYKVDSNIFISVSNIERTTGIKRSNEIISLILTEIKKGLMKKKMYEIFDIDVDGIKGIVYRTINVPDWEHVINNIATQMEEQIPFNLENVNVSYILFYPIKECIYAMTAGFGNHLIKNYIEKSWGLYLMPKLLGDDAGVIREVKETNLYGNAISFSKANRYNTNLVFEKKMSAVFRELSLEIDDEVAKILGLSNQSKKSKRKTGLLLKDSLNIRKAISIDKLVDILKEINKVEKKKDMYSMGYFVSAKKMEIPNATLFDELVECILREDIERFCIIGDDYTKYCIGASEYIICDDANNEYYTSENPITLFEIIEQMREDKKLSKSYVSNVLKKWTISTKSEDGSPVLYPIPLFRALQGFVEYGEDNIPCYLMQGDWYCFNQRYIQMLSKEFKDKYNSDKLFSDSLKRRFSLEAKDLNEDQYNDSFFTNPKVIVAHKACLDNVEVADLIYWDDTYIYLMSNKMKFDGSGCRDLTNQMRTASVFFQNQINSSFRLEFLKSYYGSIGSRYKKYSIPISEEEFIELFSKKVCFVAGYMTGYTVNSKSTYAKYLTIDSYKSMCDMRYRFVCVNIETNKKRVKS